MTAATAGLFLALSFCADEASTAHMLRSGGADLNPSLKSRLVWKGAITPVYLVVVNETRQKPWPHKPRRKVTKVVHAVVKYGVPAGFFGAALWDLQLSHGMNGRTH